MDEYVSRELLKKRFKKRLEWLKKDIHDEYSDALYDCCEIDTGLIDEIPAANVTPIVYGQWIHPHWKNSNYCCNCSECGGEAMHRDYQWHKNGVYPICPNCGAKMDIKDGDNNNANKEIN